MYLISVLQLWCAMEIVISNFVENSYGCVKIDIGKNVAGEATLVGNR